MSLIYRLPLRDTLEDWGLYKAEAIGHNLTVQANGKVGKCQSVGKSNTLAALTTSSGAIVTASNGKTVEVSASNTAKTNSYIEIPTSVAKQLSKEFSFTLWLRVDSWNTSYETYVYGGVGSAAWNNYVFGLLRNNAASSICFVISDGTSATNANCSGGALSTGVWYHVACTYGNGTMKLYIDGALVKEYATGIVPDFTKVNNFNLGTMNASGGYQTNSSMNDFRLYSHCLSLMEVKELSKGLVLHYPLDRNGWGQENLYGHGSDLQTTLSGLNNYNNEFSIVEEEGKKCAHVSGALTTAKYLQSKLTFTSTAMEQFTFSAEVKIKNIVRGTTNPMCEFYFSGATVDGAWRGFTVNYIYVDGKKVGATAIGFDRYLTDTAWHHVAVTAYFNYSGTSTIPTLYPSIYLRDCTGDLYIRNVKLERGTKATPWCPNSSNELAALLDLDTTVEYDCSGFRNNGGKTGTLTYSSDTPKYHVSSVFSGSQYINVGTQLYDMRDEMTVSAWVHKDNWNTNKGTFFSSVEGGGFGWQVSNNQWVFYMGTGTTSNSYISVTVATTGLSSGWHMLSATYDGLRLRIYIDGELKTTTGSYTTKTPIYYNVKSGMFISGESAGSLTAPSGSLWNGKLSDVRIYATALSDTDMKSLYQNSAYIDSSGNVYGAIHNEV